MILRSLLSAGMLSAAAAGAQIPTAIPPQTESDAYTRYELLAPGSAKFRILYEVTATTAGATAYYNPIRTGSVASDERVFDRSTGRPLAFGIVTGAEARGGGVPNADTSERYIRVMLAHPVPVGGGARILIEKTYQDARTYLVEGRDLVFRRPLGIKRNAVVLPSGYELVSCNVPAQVLQQPDGRIGISFLNTGPAEAPLVVRARPAAVRAGSSVEPGRLDERAHQTRAIVYFLRQPETHAFDLYHDYTETRAGSSTYVNVVRAGSRASAPSARDLDSGDSLAHELLRGDAIRQAGLQSSDLGTITPETEAIVFRFPPVAAGGSVRLRMTETYTDSARYRLVDDELVWDRSFGRPANAVVLPEGWLLTNSAIPASVSELPDGRLRLDFLNPRPDDIAVLITARRRR